MLLNILWLRTRRPVYRDLLQFWIHLFALGFAMGVVTGVVLSYEIGTNWSVFAEQTSNVIGPFFTYEALTAFFLEAGFIGIMLFGMDRVSEGLHLFSCIMVALGALFSAFWILAANSWMQTPAGFTIAGGRFQIASWWSAIFNPSFPYRFAHMVTAAYIAGDFVVIGVLGFHLWRGRHVEFAKPGFSLAMWIAIILTPLQIFSATCMDATRLPTSRSRLPRWRATGRRSAASRSSSSRGPTWRRSATSTRSRSRSSAA